MMLEALVNTGVNIVANRKVLEADPPMERCANDSYTVSTLPDVPYAGRSGSLRL